MEKKSTYAVLSKVSVKDKVEKKGHLDYLSWAHAWNILKSNYPDANRTVYECPETGLNFYTDGATAYVKVGVTVSGVEHIDYMPVMDNRMNSVSVDKLTSRLVNDSIQRSTVKAIALHGLGLSLWTGEEPEEAEAKPTPKRFVLKVDDENWSKVLKYLSANREQGLEALINNMSTKYKTPFSKAVMAKFEEVVND